jgi:hypothetical protein
MSVVIGMVSMTSSWRFSSSKNAQHSLLVRVRDSYRHLRSGARHRRQPYTRTLRSSLSCGVLGLAPSRRLGRRAQWTTTPTPTHGEGTGHGDSTSKNARSSRSRTCTAVRRWCPASSTKQSRICPWEGATTSRVAAGAWSGSSDARGHGEVAGDWHERSLVWWSSFR